MKNKNFIDSVEVKEYNGFKYICAKNYFGAYVSYIDVDKYQFLGEEKWNDMLPFHGGCTFSGEDGHLVGDGHWLIGCDWAHSYKNNGIEDVTIEEVEANIKNVIDAIPELLIMHTLETGDAYGE